jgi:hypothetical protein
MDGWMDGWRTAGPGPGQGAIGAARGAAAGGGGSRAARGGGSGTPPTPAGVEREGIVARCVRGASPMVAAAGSVPRATPRQ